MTNTTLPEVSRKKAAGTGTIADPALARKVLETLGPWTRRPGRIRRRRKTRVTA
jgi:hypothetical protein